MYNQQFLLTITGTSPYMREVKGNEERGIKLTGIVEVDNSNFFDDIEVGGKERKQGLQHILSGALPVDGEIPLKFSKRDDLVMKLPRCTKQKVEITKIKLRVPGVSKKYGLKLDLMLPNLPKTVAAEIFTKLKDSELVTIEPLQEDIKFEEPNEKNQKNNKRKK